MENPDYIDGLPNEKAIEIIGFLEKSEEKLDHSGRESATAAFNLGCTVGLIPAFVIVLIAFIATRYSWLATITVAVLMMIALVGFANLVALVSRSKSMERIYITEISPGIDLLAAEHNITHEQIYQFARLQMPETAYLRQFIPQPEPQVSHSKKRFRFKRKP
jgi:hypothetical protein